jgi:hypothetical protein
MLGMEGVELVSPDLNAAPFAYSPAAHEASEWG